MHLSDDEKSERLSEMADTVTAVGERSDVILLAMWVSPTTEYGEIIPRLRGLRRQ